MLINPKQLLLFETKFTNVNNVQSNYQKSGGRNDIQNNLQLFWHTHSRKENLSKGITSLAHVVAEVEV